MKKIFLGLCLCAGLAACQSNQKPKEALTDSPMLNGTSGMPGTVNDTSHTAAAADSQAAGKQGGAPTDTAVNTAGSVKVGNK